MTPAATVAVRTLEALGITDRDTARQALILWARPSPRLAPADLREILATFPPGGYERDDPETGAPLPEGVEGVPLGRRRPRYRQRPGDRPDGTS